MEFDTSQESSAARAYFWGKQDCRNKDELGSSMQINHPRLESSKKVDQLVHKRHADLDRMHVVPPLIWSPHRISYTSLTTMPL